MVSHGAAQLKSLSLYTAPLSGSTARVRIALNLKQVSVPVVYHEIDYAGSEHRSASYRSTNPNGSVPTLVAEYNTHSGEGATSITMTQSLAILDFIEHSFPHPSLVPPASEPLERASVIELAALVVADIQPPQSTRIRERIVTEYGGDGVAWAKGVYERGLSVYETLIARAKGSGLEGRYSVGDTVSLADVCLVPAVQAGLRVGIDLGRWPLVKAVVHECWQIEAFRKGGLGGHGRLVP